MVLNANFIRLWKRRVCKFGGHVFAFLHNEDAPDLSTDNGLAIEQEVSRNLVTHSAAAVSVATEISRSKTLRTGVTLSASSSSRLQDNDCDAVCLLPTGSYRVILCVDNQEYYQKFVFCCVLFSSL